MRLITSSLLQQVPGVFHAFGSRENPLPVSLPNFYPYWELRPQWKQIHGVRAVEVTGAKQFCGEADAFWTETPGIPLGILTADCVPILLARKDGRKIAAIHAGWRGTQAKITDALADRLRSQNENPADWVAAIGPAIGPCCYEVSESLASDFQKRFPEIQAVPSPRRLDLLAINAASLKQIGVGEIDLIRACTCCSKTATQDFQFSSYRRDKTQERQISVILKIPAEESREFRRI